MTSVELWRSAADLAARLHAGHVRRDGQTPYVAHVFRVALTVRDTFGCDDPVALAAALLHDTIEDTPADYDQIEEAMGNHVADIVAALTKNMALPEAQREIEYDERLGKADWRARLIKLADVLDNLIDTDGDDAKRMASMVIKCGRALDLAINDTEPSFEKARELVANAVRERTASA